VALKEVRIHSVYAENDNPLTVRLGAMAGADASAGNQESERGSALPRCHFFPPMYPKVLSCGAEPCWSVPPMQALSGVRPGCPPMDSRLLVRINFRVSGEVIERGYPGNHLGTFPQVAICFLCKPRGQHPRNVVKLVHGLQENRDWISLERRPPKE
jgi:hypothetical protein